jgi:hypothetical protein
MTEFRMVDRVVGNIEAGTEAPLRFSAPNSRLTPPSRTCSDS